MFSTSALFQEALILAVLWLHVGLAPYTKVEESFNLHATHDIIFYGLSTSALKNFDHFTFPGPVPRSFIGSIVLSFLVKPFVSLGNFSGFCPSKFDLQVLVRLALATFNGFGLCCIRRLTSKYYGTRASWLFTLFTVSQFHLPFWIGRTLPNMYALFPVTLANHWLSEAVFTKQRGRYQEQAIGLLIFSCIVLRAELVMLLAPLCLRLLLDGNLTVVRLIAVGFKWGLISLVLTVCIDTYVWDSMFLWPELRSAIFNVIDGKSSDWGVSVSPISTYFANFLPKLLLSALPFALLGVILDRRMRHFLFPSIIFIVILSGLGHKEWRFISYTIPIFNVSAARGAHLVLRGSRNRILASFAKLLVVGALLSNLAVTIAFTYAAMLNYPGGQALHSLQEMLATDGNVSVYIDNLAAQTGASLFLQEGSPPFNSCTINVSGSQSIWKYHKLTSDLNEFTHVIVEDNREFLSPSTIRLLPSGRVPILALDTLLQKFNVSEGLGIWRPLAVVYGFDGWGRDQNGRWILSRYVPTLFVTPKLWILQRVGN